MNYACKLINIFTLVFFFFLDLNSQHQNFQEYIIEPESPSQIQLLSSQNDNNVLIIPLEGGLEVSESVASDSIQIQPSDESGFNGDVSNLSSSSNEGAAAVAKKRTRTDEPVIKVGRKRVAQSARWKQNMRKKASNTGKEYVTFKGKVKSARAMEEPCNLSCRYKCRSKLSEEDRQEIFNKFWGLGDHQNGHERQWYFIRGCLSVGPKASNQEQNSRRNTSRIYSFRVKKENIRVCKTMFLATLNITDSWVETIVKKMNEGGTISPDKRGKNRAGVKKVDPRIIQSVKDHINSIPRVESHYIRKDSSREYLPEGLNNVSRMFDLYKDWLNEEVQKNRREAHPPASERQYRDTFNDSFNLGFFLPKKDQCDVCNAFENSTEEEKVALQASFDEHNYNKEKAQDFKKRDAERAKDKDNKSTLCVAAFDYQKVLQTPQAKSSIFYYKRKLGVYNFTVYDIGRHEGTCYVYDQTTATKGPNEVSSFGWHYFRMKVLIGIIEFIFYSDNCPSQNRNRFLFAMYVLAAARFNIKITHVFLEKGHTHNEGDSMHSVIERKCKGNDIFTLQQWIGLIKTAKRSKTNPYKVIEVKQDMIYDFKDLVSKQNWLKDENNVTVPWSKIKMVSADGNEPGKLRYYLDYEGEGSILCTKAKTAGRPLNLQTCDLKPAYSGPCKISYEKYKDLVALCDKNAIPQEHQQYFRELPHATEEESRAAKAAKGPVTTKNGNKRSAPPQGPSKTKRKKNTDTYNEEDSNPDDPDPDFI